MSWIIRLQHLPLSANAADIRAFFAGLRIPDGAVHIVGGVDGDAFIGFATDEDARQAMTYDQRRIHDQRVRLLLSSRVEMETVIAKARAGELGGVGSDSVSVSPRAEDAQSLLARQIASASSEYLQHGTQQSLQGGGDVYGMRNGASHSGSGISAGHQSDFHQQDYSRGGNVGSSWGRGESQSESWKSGNQNNYESRSSNRQTVAVSSQHAVIPWQDPKVLNVLSHSGSNHTSSSVPVYQQSGGEERFSQYDQDVSFQGYNASLQPLPATSYAQGITSNGEETRRILGQIGPDPVVTAAFPQGPLVPPVLPGQPFQMPSPIPGLVMPAVLANQGAANSPSVSIAQSGVPINTQNPYAPFTSQNAPIFPPVPIRRTEKQDGCYVELSRLPTELLRPSALENFLRPTVALTLSSVKVVFDPKGFPLHSLVRFENVKDAESVLSRDGEQGIRIRKCTKEMFDAAVDGSVLNLANSLPYKENFKTLNRDQENNRAATQNGHSFPNRTYYPMEKRDGILRREDRGNRVGREVDERNFYRGPRRGRSRSPANEYHEPKRRREDGGRYCIEFTNLPFRVTEAEIRQYFGPLCEPLRVTRAYYEDGKPSDRWVIEFSTAELADRAYRLRGKIQDRLLRARWLNVQEADELLAIPDKFGMQRREEYEKKQGFGDLSKNVPNYDSSTGKGRESHLLKGPYNQAPTRESVGLLGGPPSGNIMRQSGSSGPSRNTFQNNQGGQPKLATSFQRFPGPRNARGNGPLLHGNPRPPLIPPPTFFGTAPSSNIKQRGPPTQPPLAPVPSLNGPRAPVPRIAGASKNFGGTFSSTNGKRPATSNGPVTTTVANKPCIVLANVPDTADDNDLAEFLQIPLSKINDKSRRRMLDSSVYIDLASAEDATRTASRCNRQLLGNNCVLVTAITREQMMEGLEKKVAFSEQKEIEPDVIASVGPPGTVISCHGFPPDVTLNDVMQFFDKYSLVENSVRIKLDDGGNPTGECLLAVGSPQEASKAVMLLSGRRLNGSTVTMAVVKSPTA